MRRMLLGVVGLVVVLGLVGAGVVFYYVNYSPYRTIYTRDRCIASSGGGRLAQGGEVGCGLRDPQGDRGRRLCRRHFRAQSGRSGGVGARGRGVSLLHLLPAWRGAGGEFPESRAAGQA